MMHRVEELRFSILAYHPSLCITHFFRNSLQVTKLFTSIDKFQELVYLTCLRIEFIKFLHQV